MRANSQLCTFFLGDLLLGVEVRQVQEVVRHQELTRVPLAPGPIRGLLNLRGQIVLAIDLRRCLGLGTDASGRPPMHVVVRTSDEPVSLLVDRIGDIVEGKESDFERAPGTLRGTARELIRGAYKLDGCLLLELDMEKAVEIASVG